MFRKTDRISKIGKGYSFSAAHHLPNTHEDHQCHRLHGHNYRVEVTFVGVIDEKYGWVHDFSRLDELMDPLIKQLDHRCLNDIEGLENPTAEELALWIMGKVKGSMYSVRVYETDKAFAEVVNTDGLWPIGYRFR